ncbi:MAG: hypothetical protein K2M91_04465 [Lachnospiraceae bacterium]|nr:hypothetical protein [Lachnospiraceae bacterium]
MADLKKEYTDINDIKHTVEHSILSTDSENNKEQIIEELFLALTKPDKNFAT